MFLMLFPLYGKVKVIGMLHTFFETFEKCVGELRKNLIAHILTQ